MILQEYQKKFNQALHHGEQKEALFQLHLMLQRDPLDQRGEIINALRQLRDRWPDLPTEMKWPSLPTQEASVDVVARSFGDALQLFEEIPTEQTLQRIRILAQHLIELNELEPAVYESVEELPNPTSFVDHTSQRRKPSIQQPWITSKWMIFVFMGMLAAGTLFYYFFFSKE